MTDDTRDRSRKLFAMLASWVQDCPAAAKLARGIRQQNGYEFWRLLYREFAPENHSKALIWRRSLLSPKFPQKEQEFSAALQEWEADLDRYEAEYGPAKAIGDEDKRAVVITEAPSALRQHLAMHTATLVNYEDVRNVVVSYLQAKRVWTPSATYAGTSRKDPNAMDIGRVGDGDKGHKGKGKGHEKGDNKKGKGNDKPKGKGSDGKGSKDNDKPKCAICWKNSHTTDKCWYNGKGKGKTDAAKPGKSVSHVTDETESQLSAGPSASQITTAPSSTARGVRSVASKEEKRMLRVASAARAVVMPQAILELTDQPGWHDLADMKVFVVNGRSQQTRHKVTPGRDPTYSLRTTWQLSNDGMTWELLEHRVKWKLLANPREPFQGANIKAVMIFELGPSAKVARVGDLLVDTGACTSVCRPDAFGAEINPDVAEELYTVDDSPLHSRGECRPNLSIGSGQHRLEAQVAFQVVDGLTENILSVNRALDAGAGVWFSPKECYIEWPDKTRASFRREGRQFLLSYKEMLGPNKTKKKVAVVDEEAEAVAEYAARCIDTDTEEEMVVDAPGPEAGPEEEEAEGNLEDEVAEPEDPEGRALMEPAEPTAAEKATHALTHLPFQPWCEVCVAGKSKHDHHRRRHADSERATPVVQIDFLHLGRHAEQVDQETALLTILMAVDTTIGWPCAIQVPKKGMESSKYAVETLTFFTNRLSQDKIILQHDAEPSLTAMANAVQRHIGASRVQLRASPVRSHQSQGSVESANGFVAGQIRTMWADLKTRYEDLEPSHNSMPWLVRHAAWLIARYHVRNSDKMTPFKMVNGDDYNKPICVFGEVVMGKIPMASNKLNRKWFKGIWLGKLERDDSNVIGTEAGAIAVRSVRRLPPANQIDAEIMSKIKGLPWRPKDGHRQVTREKSEVVIMPAPVI